MAGESSWRRWLARGISARLGLGLAVGAWGGGFGLLASLRHHSVLTQRYDLGNMTQAVWNTAHGHVLEVTEVGGEQVSRLGIHVDPILAVFAPLWWLWPSPLMLLATQTAALAAGALPVFWLARKHLGSQRAGLKLAIVYLLYPPLQWNALHEFHAVALAVPLLLLAIWYLDERRMLPFVLCATAAALTKEHIGLVIALLGLWHALRSRELGRGFAIACAGTAWTALALGVVIPYFSEGGSPYEARYQSVGGGPVGMIETAFTHPGDIIEVLGRPSNVVYIVFLGLPLLGICFLSPLVLAATPQLALSTLSLRVGDTDMAYQNALPLIPVLLAATVLGAARIAKNPSAVANRVLVVSIAMAVVFGPIRFFASLGEIPGFEPPVGPVAAQRDAIALIPPAAPVSATNHLGGHLSERRHVYVFPAVSRAEWIAVDVHDAWLPVRRSFSGGASNLGIRDGRAQPTRMAHIVGDLRRDPSWRLVFEQSGILVFRRATST